MTPPKMKPHSLLILTLAGSLLAGASLTTFAQSEQVKKKAKDLKKQVETDSASKTNAPDQKPKK